MNFRTTANRRGRNRSVLQSLPVSARGMKPQSVKHCRHMDDRSRMSAAGSGYEIAVLADSAGWRDENHGVVTLTRDEIRRWLSPGHFAANLARGVSELSSADIP